MVMMLFMVRKAAEGPCASPVPRVLMIAVSICGRSVSICVDRIRAVRTYCTIDTRFSGGQCGCASAHDSDQRINHNAIDAQSESGREQARHGDRLELVDWNRHPEKQEQGESMSRMKVREQGGNVETARGTETI